jgi:Ser/Thr protein kinase RdoA (MazF antagonist)
MLVPNVLVPARFQVIEQAAERIAAIMAELGTAPAVWGAVHGDIHHDNVLFAGDEIYLIDWTPVRLAHYCYELGVTLYHIFYQGPAMRCALLEGYTEVRGLPNDHIQILEAMIAYAALDNLAWNSTIPTQLDAPLFRRNVRQFVDGFCASLVVGRSFLLTADH